MKKGIIALILGLMILTGCEGNSGLTQNIPLQLSMKEAKQIALTHASLALDEAQFETEELIDGNPSYYLLIMKQDQVNYIYKIDVSTGKILVSSNQESDSSIANIQKESLDLETKDKTASSEKPKETTPEKPKESTSNSKDSTPAKETSKNITKERALEIALKDAGLSKSSISRLEIERDFEKGFEVYQVEFRYNNYEYEYDIIIKNGAILKKEIEYEGSFNTGSPVSMAQAKEMVLRRVPGANNNHVRIKEDYDDGRLQFEGHLNYNGIEYEFEIDAQTGIFVEWEETSLYH